MPLDALNPARNRTPTAPAYPWTPDQGDGTYSNPILCADYSDPDVIRHGEDYYLVASSFNCTPGLPILHSHDLVNWTIIAHAVKNLPHPRFRDVQPGCGIWAPAIRFHGGKFWIFFPMPDEGIYVTTADNPAGTWSEPRLVQAGKGLIDPCPLWDEDGRAYLVHAYAFSRSGIRHKLRVCPLAPDGSRLLDEGRIVFESPARQPTIEGPKFLKRDGWYYILAPAGGVQTGWQTVLRSRDIYGPYEEKIVLEQGSTEINGPHQGALVDTPGGEWWFIHFQDIGVYGRIVHLQPVVWSDGWPLMGRRPHDNSVGEPVLHHRKPAAGHGARVTIPQTSDEFDSPRLGLQWQWHANHDDRWYSLTARAGWLRLFAQRAPESDPALAPHLLLQKFPARTLIAETLLEVAPGESGDEAGLIIAGNACAALAVRYVDQSNQIIFRNNGTLQILQTGFKGAIRLRAQVEHGGHCSFSYARADGEFTRVPEAFQARAGAWIGAKIGLYVFGTTDETRRGHADFDYFRFATAGKTSPSLKS